MDGAMGALKTEFASYAQGVHRRLCWGKSPLKPMCFTPINQVGTVNVPEPRMVTVNVWDKSMVNSVEKAIRESGLGINPQLNGKSYVAILN